MFILWFLILSVCRPTRWVNYCHCSLFFGCNKNCIQEAVVIAIDLPTNWALSLFYEQCGGDHGLFPQRTRSGGTYITFNFFCFYLLFHNKNNFLFCYIILISLSLRISVKLLSLSPTILCNIRRLLLVLSSLRKNRIYNIKLGPYETNFDFNNWL